MTRAHGRALRAAPAILAAAVFLILTARFAWAHVFGRFTPFDDEGFFMMALLQIRSGRVLYDDLPNIYGPLSYLLKLLVHAVLPLDHRHVRLVTIVAWQGAAVLCAATTLKLTRSAVLAILVYLLTFFQLTALALEPGHPQELGVLLVAAAPLAAALAGARHSRACLALGALAVAALLTKINIGLFLGFAVLWALVARLESGARFPRAPGIAALALTVFAGALPFLLMRNRLHEPAAAVYAQLVSGSVLAAALALSAERRPGALAPRASAFLVLGGLGAAALILGATLALGSSPGAMLRCLFIEPMRFADRLYYPQPLIKSPRAYAVIGLSLAAGVAALRFTKLGPERRAWLYAALKVAFGVVVAVNAYNGVYRLFYRAPPLLWVLLLPLGEDRRRGPDLARAVLAAAALLQTLVAYPVPGSQVQWAGFLLITAGAVAAADGLRFFAEALPERLRERGRRLAPVVALPALLAMYPLFFHRPPLRTGRFELEVRGIVERYEAGYPLPLVGARGLRLPHREAARLQWMAANLAALDRPFVVFPNNQSFIFFTAAPTPSPELFFHWNSLHPERQRRLIAALEAEPRLAVLVDEELIALWGASRAGEPIRVWLEAATRPLFSLGSVSLRLRKDDPAPPLQHLSLTELKPGERGRPLAEELFAADHPASFGLSFKTRSPGPILSSEDGSAVLLEVDEEGRLRVGEAASAEPVTDGAWHHAALVLEGGAWALFLDGALAGRSAARGLAAPVYGGRRDRAFPGLLGGLVLERRAWPEAEVLRRSRAGR